jgi:hypothetical protein
MKTTYAVYHIKVNYQTRFLLGDDVHVHLFKPIKNRTFYWQRFHRGENTIPRVHMLRRHDGADAEY